MRFFQSFFKKSRNRTWNCYKKLTFGWFPHLWFHPFWVWKIKLPPIRVEFFQKNAYFTTFLAQPTRDEKNGRKMSGKRAEYYGFLPFNYKRARVLYCYLYKNVRIYIKIHAAWIFIQKISYFFKKGIDISDLVCYNGYKIE